MTDFLKLADEIASQVDGRRRLSTDTAGAPAGTDIAWIELANEREGLRLVLRRGYGSDSTRLRATMGVTEELRGGADYRALPKFHELETAAALSRGARVIAAQIETKIIQPALPMLEQWRGVVARNNALKAGVSAAVERYRAAYPRADIFTAADGFSAEFRIRNADGRYLVGRIDDAGGLYVERISTLPESAALALVASLIDGSN